MKSVNIAAECEVRLPSGAVIGLRVDPFAGRLFQGLPGVPSADRGKAAICIMLVAFAAAHGALEFVPWDMATRLAGEPTCVEGIRKLLAVSGSAAVAEFLSPPPAEA